MPGEPIFKIEGLALEPGRNYGTDIDSDPFYSDHQIGFRPEGGPNRKHTLAELRNSFDGALYRHGFSDEHRHYLLNAFNFAAVKHCTKPRKSGDPYFIHPYQVAMDAISQNGGVGHVVVALLHDTVEESADRNAVLGEIQRWFGGHAKVNVDHLTHKYQGSSIRQYRQYFNGIFNNTNPALIVAKWVKLLDSWHNLRTLGNITNVGKRNRQLAKYKHAYGIVARFDPAFAEKFRLELLKWGVRVKLAPPRRQVVRARSRESRDQRYIESLPRPDALCGVVYDLHRSRPNTAVVGLPIFRGPDDPEIMGRYHGNPTSQDVHDWHAKFWADRLEGYFVGGTPMEGNRGVSVTEEPRSLPGSMGGRVHLAINFRHSLKPGDLKHIESGLTLLHKQARVPWKAAVARINDQIARSAMAATLAREELLRAGRPPASDD